MPKERKATFHTMDATPLAFRSKRIRERKVIPKAIKQRLTTGLVKRKELFNSLGHPSFNAAGLIAISNGSSLTIHHTITDVKELLWLMVPEASFFVDAIATPNEWPGGNTGTAQASFFSSATARQNPSNYNYMSNIRYSGSTDSVIRWSVRFTNNTGGSVQVGVVTGMRFVLNAAESGNT